MDAALRQSKNKGGQFLPLVISLLTSDVLPNQLVEGENLEKSVNGLRHFQKFKSLQDF